MAAAAFFPLVFLHLMSNGTLFFHLALELAAAFTTYALARRLNLVTAAAVAAAIAFGLNGTFSWLDAANVNPIPLLPPLLLGIELARERDAVSRRWGRVLIGVSLALSIYAGFPEVTAIDALFAGFWFLLRLPGLSADAMWRYVRSTLAGGAVGLLLSTPLIVSFLDYIVNADLGDHVSRVANMHLPSSAASMVSLPYVFGPIFGLLRRTRQELSDGSGPTSGAM